jgi:hypothetical protein
MLFVFGRHDSDARNRSFSNTFASAHDDSSTLVTHCVCADGCGDMSTLASDAECCRSGHCTLASDVQWRRRDASVARLLRRWYIADAWSRWTSAETVCPQCRHCTLACTTSQSADQPYGTWSNVWCTCTSARVVQLHIWTSAATRSVCVRMAAIVHWRADAAKTPVSRHCVHLASDVYTGVVHMDIGCDTRGRCVSGCQHQCTRVQWRGADSASRAHHQPTYIADVWSA